MSYLPTPMGPSQPRNFYPPTAMPTYRPTPRWSGGAAGAAALRHQTGQQMIAGMQLQQSMAAAQHRSAQMTGLPTRPAMPMGRPTSGQMMNAANVRPQLNVQQQPAAYTRTARNLPQNNPGGFPNSIVVAGQEPLTPAALANATPHEQKQTFT